MERDSCRDTGNVGVDRPDSNRLPLTVGDAERVAEWLILRGHSVLSYTGPTDPQLRLEAEAALQANEIKALVATTALGMGYDKPDLGFVVHYQSPGSPVFYYQQVGRAGRAVESSVGVLLRGDDDEAIQDWFIERAFPDERHVNDVLRTFDEALGALTLGRIEEQVNLKRGALELVLKQLTVEGVLERLKAQTYERTLKPWQYPHARVQAVTVARRHEQEQMRSYATTDVCRMVFLTRLLDDASEETCGICDVCADARYLHAPDTAVVAEAHKFLRHGFILIEPRRKLIDEKLSEPFRLEHGRALCMWGDQGWGPLVVEGKHDGISFDDQPVAALADLVAEWRPEPAPTWITFVPSLRHPGAGRRPRSSLGSATRATGSRDCCQLRETAQQKGMQNSAHQFQNVQGAFGVAGALPAGPVFLVDDLVDSRWTLTEIGRVLRMHGSGPVFPLVLASTVGRDS